MPLQMKDCPGPKCAYEMTEEERRALGITKRMPLNAGEARHNLAIDMGMEEVLGKNFIEKYLSVNQASYFCERD